MPVPMPMPMPMFMHHATDAGGHRPMTGAVGDAGVAGKNVIRDFERLSPGTYSARRGVPLKAASTRVFTSACFWGISCEMQIR